MYVPPVYALDDADAWECVDRAGAGALVVATSSGLRSVVAPVLVDASARRLRGHVSRANPWWRDACGGDEAIGIFTLAHTYVSPGFYPTKSEDPAVVPTWDYVSVEVRGTLTLHDDVIWTRELVGELTTRFESEREEPWSLEDAPGEYVERLVRGIVGFALEVHEIAGAAKLSQNKGPLDRRGVRDQLARGDERARTVAREMRDLA